MPYKTEVMPRQKTPEVIDEMHQRPPWPQPYHDNTTLRAMRQRVTDLYLTTPPHAFSYFTVLACGSHWLANIPRRRNLLYGRTMPSSAIPGATAAHISPCVIVCKRCGIPSRNRHHTARGSLPAIADLGHTGASIAT